MHYIDEFDHRSVNKQHSRFAKKRWWPQIGERSAITTLFGITITINFLNSTIGDIYVPKCLVEFQLRDDSWLFLFWNWACFDQNHKQSLMNIVAFWGQRNIDRWRVEPWIFCWFWSLQYYRWVETQINSPLGHINVSKVRAFMAKLCFGQFGPTCSGRHLQLQCHLYLTKFGSNVWQQSGA